MNLIKTLLLTLFMCNITYATPDYYTKNNVMIAGYDPVSYISDNKASKGKKSISHKYDGVVIHFTTEENKKEFIKTPKKYIPAYRGWCAYAMSKTGELVKVDPKTFKVIKGRTYLFYNSFFANTLKKWNKGEDSPQIKAADANWKKNL